MNKAGPPHAPSDIAVKRTVVLMLEIGHKWIHSAAATTKIVAASMAHITTRSTCPRKASRSDSPACGSERRGKGRVTLILERLTVGSLTQDDDERLRLIADE